MSRTPTTPEDERRVGSPERGDLENGGMVRRSGGEPLTDADLSRITTLSEGDPLQPGADYLDLLDPAARVFAATAGVAAADDQLLVARTSVDEKLWARLRALNSSDGPGVAGEG